MSGSRVFTLAGGQLLIVAESGKAETVTTLAPEGYSVRDRSTHLRSVADRLEWVERRLSGRVSRRDLEEAQGTDLDQIAKAVRLSWPCVDVLPRSDDVAFRERIRAAALEQGVYDDDLGAPSLTTGPIQYTATELHALERAYAGESQRAEAKMREHMAAAHRASGDRLKVIRAFVELASCRARRAREWERFCTRVLDSLDEDPEEGTADAGG